MRVLSFSLVFASLGGNCNTTHGSTNETAKSTLGEISRHPSSPSEPLTETIQTTRPVNPSDKHSLWSSAPDLRDLRKRMEVNVTLCPADSPRPSLLDPIQTNQTALFYRLQASFHYLPAAQRKDLGHSISSTKPNQAPSLMRFLLRPTPRNLFRLIDITAPLLETDQRRGFQSLPTPSWAQPARPGNDPSVTHEAVGLPLF
jgi:hypothetical protein